MITDLLRGVAARRRRRPGTDVTAAAAGAGAGGRGPGELAISYEPRRDGRPDPGEVVWTWVPYEEDPSQGKDRPVVVIGHIGAALAGIALTTKASGPARDRITIGVGEWDPARRPSFAKIDRVLAIDAAGVRREGATFERARFDQLVDAVRSRHPELIRVPDRAARETGRGSSRDVAREADR